MMNKEPNGADMILHLLGKGECFRTSRLILCLMVQLKRSI